MLYQLFYTTTFKYISIKIIIWLELEPSNDTASNYMNLTI